ncbi:MAG: archaeosortase C [Methanosarcina mazei]
MENENKNLVIILLVLAMFSGAAVEISEGSNTIGIVLFLISVSLLTKINFKVLDDSFLLNKSKVYFAIGFLIISADLLYNFRNGDELRTLDLMALLFGISLIGTQLHNPQITRTSKFGMYISSVFVILYLIFYTMFAFLGIDFLHKFDHYMILLPTVKIINTVGIPMEVIATETVRVCGIEEMTVVIGGPCSGLYSMFLLIGIVFGYSRIEKMDTKKTLIMLGFCVAVAYVSNLFRVIVLYLTAYYYGRETMMLVHTHIGWIIFAGVAACVMYLIELRR